MTDDSRDPGREIPSSPPTAFEYRIRPSTVAVRLARYALADWLAAQHFPSDDAVDDLLIACSELCTNALVHAPAGSQVTLRARTDGDAVVVEVEDARPAGREAVEPAPWDGPGSMGGVRDDDEHGRGLFIVTALCDDVAVASTAAGTTVRCRKAGVLGQPAGADAALSRRFRAHPRAESSSQH